MNTMSISTQFLLGAAAKRDVQGSVRTRIETGLNQVSNSWRDNKILIIFFTHRLRSCHITDSGCTELSSALRLNPSHLRELDLSGNYIGYSRVEKLAALLADPLCKLEKLR